MKIALGNGLRGDVWREFIRRFGDIHVYEFYASTEGNIGFVNYPRKIGAVGRANYLQRVKYPESWANVSLASEIGSLTAVSRCCIRTMPISTSERNSPAL